MEFWINVARSKVESVLPGESETDFEFGYHSGASCSFGACFLNYLWTDNSEGRSHSKNFCSFKL